MDRFIESLSSSSNNELLKKIDGISSQLTSINKKLSAAKMVSAEIKYGNNENERIPEREVNITDNIQDSIEEEIEEIDY
ncbi:hypothetical protein [Halalkalibacter hemicellulosilyticus]|nr:hypothetical protein [Halalkalibacter hemicellulosilyticus]